MKNKIFSLILTLSMVVSLFAALPVTASAAESGSCGDNLNWMLDDAGTLTINGFGEMYDYKIYNGDNDPVRAPWYNSNSSIINVVIQYGVSSIGNFSFDSCRNLTSITIPNSVSKIGYGAFQSCSSLSTISIPNSVTCIEPIAFKESGITDVTIPNSVVTIGNLAFKGCYKLTNITIQNGVVNIEDGAFEGCRFTKIRIPESVASIGDNIFMYCKELEWIDVDSNNQNYTSNNGVLFNKSYSEIISFPKKELEIYIIPNSVTSIANGAFNGCKRLKNVTIPESVTYIGNCSFMKCENLTSFRIPDGVHNIGHNTFCDCESLVSISIPKSVTSVDDLAFYNCKNLIDVQYAGNEQEWNKISIEIFNTDLQKANIHYNSYPKLLVIPDEAELQHQKLLVVLNGECLAFHDQPPIIIDGRTLVPLRAIFEALGATVDWDGNNQTVTATRDNTVIKITIGDNKLYVNNNVTVLDVPAQIINDRTLVPVRAVSEAFGCNVEWDGNTRTVSIVTN